MPASYPDNIKTWVDKADFVDDVRAADINGAYAEIIAIETEVDAHKADDMLHNSDVSLYRLNKDANGVFTELQYKRANGTLFKKSVLSGGISPKYTARTVTYYKADGETVNATKVYTEVYTGDDLTSEVLQ